VPVPVLAMLAVTVFVAAGLPMRCRGPTSRRPFRGCLNVVCGFFGHCRNHGFQPGRRLIATLGGDQLLSRRTCGSCGQLTVFGRDRDDGKPFLGCTAFPDCRNKHRLAG
jgi:hypothetical protein